MELQSSLQLECSLHSSAPVHSSCGLPACGSPLDYRPTLKSDSPTKCHPFKIRQPNFPYTHSSWHMVRRQIRRWHSTSIENTSPLHEKVPTFGDGKATVDVSLCGGTPSRSYVSPIFDDVLHTQTWDVPRSQHTSPFIPSCSINRTHTQYATSYIEILVTRMAHGWWERRASSFVSAHC